MDKLFQCFQHPSFMILEFSAMLWERSKHETREATVYSQLLYVCAFGVKDRRAHQKEGRVANICDDVITSCTEVSLALSQIMKQAFQFYQKCLYHYFLPEPLYEINPSHIPPEDQNCFSLQSLCVILNRVGKLFELQLLCS